MAQFAALLNDNGYILKIIGYPYHDEIYKGMPKRLLSTGCPKCLS